MQLTLPFRTKRSLSASDETAELYIHNFCWFQPQSKQIATSKEHNINHSLSACLLASTLSSFLGLPNDFWAAKSGIDGSPVFLERSSAEFSEPRGLTSFFWTSSNFAVEDGVVLMLLFESNASMVSADTSSREAYQELPQATHSSWRKGRTASNQTKL